MAKSYDKVCVVSFNSRTYNHSKVFNIEGLSSKIQEWMSLKNTSIFNQPLSISFCNCCFVK